MNPLNSDESLDKELELLVYAIRNDGWNNGFNTPDKPWVAQIKKLLLQAKIEELKLGAEYEMGSVTVIGRHTRSYQDRLADLTTQLEEIK